MDLDYILISRIGFALTASYHIIFPSLIAGLIVYLLAMEILWLRTGKVIYRHQYELWIKPLFAAFVVAIITGVALSFQLDTHFGGFYRKTVDVLVPIRHIELVNTIVLEAGMLGIMRLGWKRVGNRLHLGATIAMALGVLIAFCCIIARNSWMQTPDGYALENNVLVLKDWWSAVISPSFPFRFAHMLTAALLSTAFFMLGLSAWLLLKRCRSESAGFSLRIAIFSIALLAPLQLFIGHLHGINTQQHQPVKVAAMEGLWETTESAPMVLFAIPDGELEANRAIVQIPRLGSIILTHTLNGKVEGLKQVPKENRPNVTLVFYSFRIMVAMGLLMIVVGVIGFILWIRHNLFNNRSFLIMSCLMTPVGFVATIAGWCVSEAGRQPWVIHGMTRTADVVLPISASEALQSLTIMGIVYSLTFVGFVAYMWHVVRREYGAGDCRTSFFSESLTSISLAKHQRPSS